MSSRWPAALALVLLPGFVLAGGWDETRFFRTTPPTFETRGSAWRLSNLAIAVEVQYEPRGGGLLLSQVEDRSRRAALLFKPCPLLVLRGPKGGVLLDLSQGWTLSEPPKGLTPRKGRRGESVASADFTLRSRGVPAVAAKPVSVTIRLTIFPGDEPYATFEPFLKGKIKPQCHVYRVQYAHLFARGRCELRPSRCGSYHQTMAPRGAAGGLWSSIGNYAPYTRLTHGGFQLQATANIYLDHYLAASGGSLGTWMLGVYAGSADAAKHDYQLFLIKHWTAGDHRSIPPHLHDHWYRNRSRNQPERVAPIGRVAKECGFHFFWLIWGAHGVWPDWRLRPEAHFPGGVDASNPGSVAGTLAEAGMPLALYTAPCRVGKAKKYHLRHDDCRKYGQVLGEAAKRARAPVWWYEDHPGAKFATKDGLPNQPPGRCSWMWRQGYRLTRETARQHKPGLMFCRTWVPIAEQLGWAEACSCLDVYGRSKKGWRGDMSGGYPVGYDFALSDNWRTRIWPLAPIWPLMNHIGHNPVHVRDSRRKPSDSEYLNSAAAMMGPYSMTGPIAQTTAAERALHRKWAGFNWKHREFLRFSSLPVFIGDAGEVDGIYHLANPDATGLCGFIGLWNKDDERPATITLAVPLSDLRLRWAPPFRVRTHNGALAVPAKREGARVVIGPVDMGARSWQVMEIRSGVRPEGANPSGTDTQHD